MFEAERDLNGGRIFNNDSEPIRTCVTCQGRTLPDVEGQRLEFKKLIMITVIYNLNVYLKSNI